MSNTVIKVENLGKSYSLRHQTGERYTALRDVLTNGARNLGSRLLRTASSHQPAAISEEFWALNDVSFEVVKRKGKCPQNRERESAENRERKVHFFATMTNEAK